MYIYHRPNQYTAAKPKFNEHIIWWDIWFGVRFLKLYSPQTAGKRTFKNDLVSVKYVIGAPDV